MYYRQVTRRACLTWGTCTASSSSATSRGSTSRSASPRPTVCPRPAASSTSATTRPLPPPPPPSSPGAAAWARRTGSWSPGRGGAWGRGPGAGPASTGAGWRGVTATCHTACSGTVILSHSTWFHCHLVTQTSCHTCHTVILSHSCLDSQSSCHTVILSQSSCHTVILCQSESSFHHDPSNVSTQ